MSTRDLPPGPIMLDLKATELDGEERELLEHPLVGGVIFFSRNFHHREQIAQLTAEIARLRSGLLLCVDQEGGWVQRFREGFTRLPACRRLGDYYQRDSSAATAAARQLGWLMATELRAVGIDFSFAPVLDRDTGVSEVIGDRAFASDIAALIELAQAYVAGMAEAGMAAIGKHFPGHGAVGADSHTELPVDERRPGEIESSDLRPFAALIQAQALAGIMPAHVIYSAADPQPAGFSHYWLQTVLRGRLGFQGVIFSDDLNMAAAQVAGGFSERAEAAWAAGCDVLLVCNNRAGAIQVLDEFRPRLPTDFARRLLDLKGRPAVQNPAASLRKARKLAEALS